MFHPDFTTLTASDRDEILADADCALPEFADFLAAAGGEGTIRIERAELPFYSFEASCGETQPFRLLRFTGTNEDCKPLYALYSPGALYPLDGTNGPIHSVNPLAPFHLPGDREQAVEVACAYVRFFFRFVAGRHGRFLVLEPGDIPQEDERPPLHWSGNTSPDDKQNVASLIEPLKPINVVIEDEGTAAARTQRVELAGTILFRNTLFTANLVVEADGSVGLHNEEILQDNLPLSDAGAESEFRTGMRRIPPVHWVTRLPPPQAGTALRWIRTTGDERESVLEWVRDRENGEALTKDGALIRKALLPFYDNRCSLYEILAADLTRRAYLLGYYEDSEPTQSQYWPIDWTSDPIHEANVSGAILGFLDQDRLDREAAGHYLRFFCWAVAGDEGRFLLPERVREPAWTEWPGCAILEKIEPLRVIDRPEDCPPWVVEGTRQDWEGRFHYTATVAYGDALFRAFFSVHPEVDGVTIAMEDDEPIARDLPLARDEVLAGRGRSLLVLGDKPAREQAREEQGTQEAREAETNPTTWATRHLELQKRDDCPHYLNAPGPTTEPEEVTPREFLERLLGSPERRIGNVRVVPENDQGMKEILSFRELESHGPCVIHHVRFEKGAVVDLSGLRMAGIEFNHCVFMEGLQARGTQFKGDLTLHVCDLDDPGKNGEDGRGCLDLEGIRVEGSLRLNNLHCIGRINAQSMRIGGDCFMNGLYVARSCPDRTTVGGLLNDMVQEASPDDHWAVTVDKSPRGVGQKFKFGSEGYAIALSGSRFGGSLELGIFTSERNTHVYDSELRFRRPLVAGNIAATHVTVEGTLVLSGLVCMGNVDFRHATIKGNVVIEYQYMEEGGRPLRTIIQGRLWFSNGAIQGGMEAAGAWIGGELNLVSSRLGKSLFARDTHLVWKSIPLNIGGQLVLSGAEIGGIELSAARIEGGIEYMMGRIGRLRIEPGRVRATPFGGSDEFRIERCRLGPVVLRSVEITEDCWICYADIRQSEKEDVSESKGASEKKCSHDAVSIDNCRIGGNLAFSRPLFRSYCGRELYLDKAVANSVENKIGVQWWVLQHPEQPEHPYTLDDAKKAVYEHLVTCTDGSVTIRQCQIGGNLVLNRMQIDCTDGQIDCTDGVLQLRRLCIDGDIYASHYAYTDQWEPDEDHKQDQTCCSELILNDVECRNHADLTGLQVGKGEGSVDASYLRVAGRVLFYPQADSISEDERKALSARLGQLDLTCASIDHLVISGDCFPPEESEEKKKEDEGTNEGKKENGSANGGFRPSLRPLLTAYPWPTAVLLQWKDRPEARDLDSGEEHHLYSAALYLQGMLALALLPLTIGAFAAPSIGWLLPLGVCLWGWQAAQRVALSLRSVGAAISPVVQERNDPGLLSRLRSWPWRFGSSCRRRLADQTAEYHAFLQSRVPDQDPNDATERSDAWFFPFRDLKPADWAWIATGCILILVLSFVMFSERFLQVLLPALLVASVFTARWACLRRLEDGKTRLPPCRGDESRESEANMRTVLAFRGVMQIWNEILRLLVRRKDESGRDDDGKDVKEEQGRNQDQAKIDFTRARFTHLELPKPFPLPANMNGITVERWELGNEAGKNPGKQKANEDEADKDARHYLELLNNSTDFDRSTYLDVERYLRNNGHHEGADRVHRAMRRREQWREDRLVRIAMMLLHSAIGYGTRRGRVLMFMLAWFLFSAFWFAIEYPDILQLTPELRAELNLSPEPPESPDSPEPPTSPKKTLQQDRPTASATTSVERNRTEASSDDGKVQSAAGDLPDECRKDSVALKDILDCIQPSEAHAWYKRTGVGFAMALRYHVPLIGLDYVPYLEPARPMVWAYAMLVVAVHWILWPLLIASLVPVLIPRRE